jgi:hypothetical protein
MAASVLGLEGLLLLSALGCSDSVVSNATPPAPSTVPTGVAPEESAAPAAMAPATDANTEASDPGVAAPGSAEGVGEGIAVAEQEPAEDGSGTSGGAADAGSSPAVASTGGSGGAIGPAELVSMGGLSYLIDAPATPGPHGLLVLLHGSTASNYRNFIGAMRDVAEAYDLIPVSVLAPNGQGWNEGNQVRAAELLHRLVQEDLFPAYDIDRARVLFSGQSSGGGFLSSNFVPAHAADYQGGAFFQCGAAPPNVSLSTSPEVREHFRLHFEITTGDPIWPESYAQSIAAYGAAQMQFTMDNTKPGGHCEFDQQQVILDHIDFVLGG